MLRITALALRACPKAHFYIMGYFWFRLFISSVMSGLYRSLFVSCFRAFFKHTLVFYKKKINISIKNTGIRQLSDQSMYPKKDGILIPFSSAMERTMKFGALPI